MNLSGDSFLIAAPFVVDFASGVEYFFTEINRLPFFKDQGRITMTPIEELPFFLRLAHQDYFFEAQERQPFFLQYDTIAV